MVGVGCVSRGRRSSASLTARHACEQISAGGSDERTCRRLRSRRGGADPDAAAAGRAAKTPVSSPAGSAPKPAPPPITSLEVAVTDPAGKPVEGAFVMAVPLQGAYRSIGGLAPEKVRSTVTGREGKAKLDSPPPGP